MKLNKLAMLPLGMALLTSANISQAIEVFPIIKDIKQESPRDNYVTVKSMYRAVDSVDTAKSENKSYEFVTLELFHITNPGDSKENMVKELGAEDPTLVFSPTKLIIPFGEERKVRIMPLKPVERETLYRLRIRPSYPEQEIDKGKVRFAIGYDVLLRYLPEGKRTQGLAVSCNGNQWTLTATGNVRSEMRDLVIDGRKDKAVFNVYPEHTRALTVHSHLAFNMDGKLYSYEKCQLKE
ncbi:MULTISPECIES: hypothetical protein [Hafnia]|uniref:Molecular chaperone n=2 Tax=Hafnia TaxID=568 RepID=A0A4Q9EII5_9GAMM|nr:MULTISPECIES: hypothetical protein [Hafnia]AJQ98924.1 hypothetical protein F652_934 [Enterobacteriaceae bacterium bta3-1]EHM46941.1 hypothetical protein HMPREF0454_00810 [Hafnia alvei ATCC 51873]QQE44615.1 hypothetical protein I6H95_04690 [Hafnia alvei]TBM23007.1 hypothetical protein EYY89_18035 [Hafnia paralvei]